MLTGRTVLHRESCIVWLRIPSGLGTTNVGMRSICEVHLQAGSEISKFPRRFLTKTSQSGALSSANHYPMSRI
jgi:hypothetical protein